ncbi:nitric-oxide reductase large subunit [Vulgatibacter sp.]|uniref:nitric-oxide reductase large subunit n=1 Tax=Vulgatibacter sp. TaxID=1971226 RepID=UPI00356358EF
MGHKKLWAALITVVVGSFAVLGWQGVELDRNLPPIPAQVRTPDGKVVADGASIRRGQNVWQSLGGQEIGSIWGHGAYVAPDWSADWLHREGVFVLDRWAEEEGAAKLAALPAERQAALRHRLERTMRTNTYDAATDTVTLDVARAAAFESNAAHYADVFARGRDAYAIPVNTLVDQARMRDMAAFFWWTSWVASTERPGDTVTYTNNWPHEPLVANRPTAGNVMWSLVSVVLLIAGIAALVAYYAKGHREEELQIPATDPLRGLRITPSQRATYKYFFTVAGLVLAQVGLGILTAHYGVEGSALFGFPLAEYLPYAVTRSWHTQLGIFWIATAWLATGLFVAPMVSGHEPKWQRAGVNFLWVCLVVIVVGSMAGQWLSAMQKLDGDVWYWLGHQGWEYVDIGRFWQIFLFVGLWVWLGLMVAALRPAFQRKSDETKPLLLLFTLSCVAIALFYGAGFMYGKGSHMATVEYWRWWVVHLWVEGFFEVFATVAIAFLFVRLGLLSAKRATPAVLFSTIIFLAGGILGTLHHLYFSGTPTAMLALGATFSALEIVPLTLVGFEVWQNLKFAKGTGWVAAYRWPILFFVAVAFWNLVGAGIFGFLINPPIALYYMQGLNLTPVHGHTALFGVYGMLGIGLMLFTLRALFPDVQWRERPLQLAFWGLNSGLVLMVVISMLPIGVLQTMAAMEHGTWWARSAEFMQTPLMQTLRWLRAPGDTVFAVGIGAIAWFVVGLKTGWSVEPIRPATAKRPVAEKQPAAVPSAARVHR